jgi:hypothetical protein
MPRLHRSPARLLRAGLALAGLALTLAPAPAQAWPRALREALARDARRLLPPSLAVLLGEREQAFLEEADRLSPELVQALGQDLAAGQLRAETLAALEARGDEAVALIRARRASEGLVRLGALARVPADLADPVLSAGPQGWPPGVAAEYYAFVEANLGKIPVVLEDSAALALPRPLLGEYWQGLVARGRAQAPVILTELFRDGRVVSHARIDHRNPVFAVASLSWSRAVNGIAVTWLAFWRAAHGDLTRMPKPRSVTPRDRGPAAAPTPEEEVLE